MPTGVDGARATRGGTRGRLRSGCASRAYAFLSPGGCGSSQNDLTEALTRARVARPWAGRGTMRSDWAAPARAPGPCCVTIVSGHSRGYWTLVPTFGVV